MKIIEIVEKYIEKQKTAQESIKLLNDMCCANKSLISPAVRFIKCIESNALYDSVSHLRQILLYEKSNIRISESYYEYLKNHSESLDLYFDDSNNIVAVKPWSLTDNDDLKYSYSFERKRNALGSYPDGDLLNYFGYDSYISIQQKLMIHSLKKMNPGDCLLACLPTGNGKSLLWQYAVASGKFTGLTVVIVPTVALISDHIKSDNKIFARLPWISSIFYSAKRNEKSETYMDELCEQIKNAKQTILYISPESLTNYKIVNALNYSAAHGNLSAIVVDEAHLIVDWGMNFRPEFQFIPALCEKYNNYESKIYTILTSATITESDSDTLRSIFKSGEFIEYRGESLRPEISYYSSYCISEKDRMYKIKKLVKSVPKPAIIYTGTKKQSDEYLELIKSMGITRVKQFTGDTSDNERDQLIELWRNDEIDIMVATSAFGMGVDKADVRTVITAYMPDSISRFYQEVGRSGRDGYSSLSFTLFCPIIDKGYVSDITDKRLLKTGSIIDRWNDIKAYAVIGDEPNFYKIDSSVTPEHLKYSKTGQKNSGWNQNVLLFLIRCGFLDIVDVKRSFTSGYKSYVITVRQKKFFTSRDNEAFEQLVEEQREKERKSILEAREAVEKMLSKNNEDCFSYYFQQEFPYTDGGCNGCPVCRKNEYSNWFPEGRISLIYNGQFKASRKYSFKNNCSMYMKLHSRGMLFYERSMSSNDHDLLVEHLIASGADIIVSEHFTNELKNKITNYMSNEYLLLTFDEFVNTPRQYIVGTITLFLDTGKEAKMLKQIEKLCNDIDGLNIVYVCEKDFYYEKEEHFLRDIVEYAIPITTILLEDVVC
ncbi:helicase-related protein [Butyrivibrio fibrisolvens]|uniref:helicase-related protein n=1 Tax=Butyrivibrio fibrisolvens TaxID=831 RepID=UPI00200A65DD|nr:helicase-related protein [Butyrivibrio fibrisolvens]